MDEGITFTALFHGIVLDEAKVARFHETDLNNFPELFFRSIMKGEGQGSSPR
jgi:hypothetical protein